MPHFIQISHSFINIDRIDRIDEGQGIGRGCTVVLTNGQSLHVKEDAREVMKKLVDAEAGRLPILTEAATSPNIH